MPEFIVEQTLILDTPDQAKAAERAQQIATFLANDWPELTLVHTGDIEPCPPFIEAADECRGAGWRQTNDAGLQFFQCCGDPADCGSCP